MKVTILLLALILTQQTFAAEKTVIVLERSTYVGREMVGIVLTDKKIDMSSNSNYWKKALPYRYGRYELKATPELIEKIKNLTVLKQIKIIDYVSPHEPLVYINGEKFQNGTEQYSKAVELAEVLFSSEGLKQISGITLKVPADVKAICEGNIEKPCPFKDGYLHE